LNDGVIGDWRKSREGGVRIGHKQIADGGLFKERH
jgi:hypothetical protein